MLKFGITSVDGLLNCGSKGNRIIGAHLLLELSQFDEETASSLRQRIVRSLLLPNTIGKTTWAGRFATLDQEVAGILKREFPDSLHCLDVGVSDGTTAVELFGCLKSIPGLRYLATDINQSIHIRTGRIWSDVLDDDGHLLQASIGPFVIPVTTLSHMHPLQLVNRSLYLYSRLVRERRAKRIWERSRKGAESRSPFVTVSLLSSSFQRLMDADDRLGFQRLDIFAPPAGVQYDFVRVMNVLNLKEGCFGFADDQVIRATAAIAELLRERGFLLLGRTVPRPGGFQTDATLFRCIKGELEKYRVFAHGAEIEDLMRAGWKAAKERCNGK
jgi:hypothetical protein